MLELIGKFLIAALIITVLVIWIPLIFVFVIAILLLAAIVFVIALLSGIPIEIKEDGKVIGHIIRFKFVPKDNK